VVCADIDARQVQNGNQNMRLELLAIDDADLHLSIVCKIATQAGFATTGANSVSEAARLLRQRTFDCITLDLSLGEQSGIDILKLLAEMKCRTPIIVVSGSGEVVCKESIGIGNFLDLNRCAPIPKPINLAALRLELMQIADETLRQKLATPVGW
jgi:two-component system, chemotaxis family, chemotaxis protein CheY